MCQETESESKMSRKNMGMSKQHLQRVFLQQKCKFWGQDLWASISCQPVAHARRSYWHVPEIIKISVKHFRTCQETNTFWKKRILTWYIMTYRLHIEPTSSIINQLQINCNLLITNVHLTSFDIFILSFMISESWVQLVPNPAVWQPPKEPLKVLLRWLFWRCYPPSGAKAQSIDL